MRKETYRANASAGKIEIVTDGDIGGNSQETTIRLTEGQFPFAKVEKDEDGVTIKIVGTWEINELTEALFKFHCWDMESWVSSTEEETNGDTGRVGQEAVRAGELRGVW